MRIIAGRLGGRHLDAPKGDSTRPTSDRVREAVFNLLCARHEPPSAVLDLYAGSGALAFESLSRGAQKATLVDESRHSVQVIEDNAEQLGVAEACRVHQQPVLTWLRRPPAGVGRFGWVFLDPPYGSASTGELHKALGKLAESGLVEADGTVIAEHEWRAAPAEGYPPLKLVERRRYGQTAVSIYKEGP